MFILLNIFWFIWMLKYVLFWLYLWQLKEYHIGRFADHFRTHKGKKLIFDWTQILKLLIMLFFLFTNLFLFSLLSVLFLVYVFQSAVFLKGIFLHNVKKPVKTSKTIFLTAVSFLAVIIFFWWTFQFKDSVQLIWILAFDILTPIIISAIVLILQPFFVFIRNIKLKKAKDKLEKIKSIGGLKVIAITGSYGKTSTKEFLTTILSTKFKVLSTTAHQNSEVGIANCILNDLKPSHQIFIAEVGAYNKGKVKEVCNILKPKIGIVTGVNEQHLSLFGSMENLVSAEGGGELSETLLKNGTLVVNGENKYCLNLYKNFDGAKKIYCLNNKRIACDIWSEDISVHKDFISFLAVDKFGEMGHFNIKVLGKQNVQNILGAILVARELGMTMGEISDACENIKQEQAGMTLLRGKNNLNIIDSSYSANPDGVFADLDYLSIFEGKKVVVMPSLIELGDRSSEIHERIGRTIGQICDLAIITSKDKFYQIKKGFDESKNQQDSDILRRSDTNVAKCLLCDNSQEIYSAITLFAKSGDAILLEGRVPQGLVNLLK